MKAPFYDIVFLQRDLLSWERICFLEKLLRRLSKKLVFDFDDAIHIHAPAKIAEIIKMSDSIVVGNKHLESYARQYNPNVKVIPTCVDTEIYSPVSGHEQSAIFIGWMGSSSGIENLKIVSGAISQLAQKYDFSFKIISDYFYQFDFLKNPEIEYRKWNKNTELENLRNFNIGIMPLEDNEMNRGKCGFKALLYMACGKPAVISPVGVNKEIIQDGSNGFLAKTESEWFKKLALLIGDKELREKLGQAGRKTVEDKYSIEANLSNFISVFQDLL